MRQSLKKYRPNKFDVGLMNKQVEVQNIISSQPESGSGGNHTTFPKIKTTKASIESISNAWKLQMGQKITGDMVNIVLRYDPQYSKNMRIIHRDRVYRITGKFNYDQDKRFIRFEADGNKLEKKNG